MPPKLSLRPLARQLAASISQQKARISSTSKNAALQDLSSSKNASSALFGLEDSALTTNAVRASASAHGPASGQNTGVSHKLMNMLDEHQRTSGSRPFAADRRDIQSRSANDAEREDLARQMSRRWKEGNAYAPHDLSHQEQTKWRKRGVPSKDAFDLLGLNPLDHYKNFSMISEYMSNHGRILHSSKTGLRPVNQRKIAKAIRRAIGMGIHPSTHKHPEILFSAAHSGPRYHELDATQNPVGQNKKSK